MRKILIALLLISLVACTQEEQATVQYETGDLIYENTFDDPDSWETFGFMETQFGISNGVYTAISDGGGYIPVTNGETHSNVVIEVTAEQIGGSPGSIYGIICRSQAANPTIGYYFLINSSGEFGIRIGESDRIRVFVPWTEHKAINEGLATNTFRVVCIDDYFAFYINDTFVAESRHDWLVEGTMGFAVNAPGETDIVVTFDNVQIWEASLVESTE